jgi:hypothetical protein
LLPLILFTDIAKVWQYNTYSFSEEAWLANFPQEKEKRKQEKQNWPSVPSTDLHGPEVLAYNPWYVYLHRYSLILNKAGPHLPSLFPPINATKTTCQQKTLFN